MQIWGLCTDCDRWFYCAGWLDRSQPAPICPACGAEPRAIENRASVSPLHPLTVQGCRPKTLPLGATG